MLLADTEDGSSHTHWQQEPALLKCVCVPLPLSSHHIIGSKCKNVLRSVILFFFLFFLTLTTFTLCLTGKLHSFTAAMINVFIITKDQMIMCNVKESQRFITDSTVALACFSDCRFNFVDLTSQYLLWLYLLNIVILSLYILILLSSSLYIQQQVLSLFPLFSTLNTSILIQIQDRSVVGHML